LRQLHVAEVVTLDLEGYGQRPGQTSIGRLLEDSRTLSPAGIERVASGWDRHAESVHDAYRRAEKAALHKVEAAGQGAEWESLRKELLGLTEVGTPMVAWRLEHGDVGHKAERALLGAALAFTAGPDLDDAVRITLLRPMAEALPWLLAGGGSSDIPD